VRCPIATSRIKIGAQLVLFVFPVTEGWECHLLSVDHSDDRVALHSADPNSTRGAPYRWPGVKGGPPVWLWQHLKVSLLFEPIEPYETGRLKISDGQHLYWETSGSPKKLTAVSLHGGPGSGCTAGGRRLFDPERYRIVQFDQRGAGRSTPRVSVTTDLSANTTAHLIADLEALREHLGVDRWLVRGTSWGVTLGLAYAQAHPEHVVGLIFNSVTMTRPHEIHWLYHEAGRFYPEAWRRFEAGVPRDDQDGDLVTAYYHLLNVQSDNALRHQAAMEWCAWEDAVSPLPGGAPHPRYADPAFRMTFARIGTHYFHHKAWLEPDQLLRNAVRLAGVPGVLIHGRLDLGGPIDTAWQLAQVWPDAELKVVGNGHTGGEEMTAAILQATSDFADLN
jgi:proline iminopeptidase